MRHFLWTLLLCQTVIGYSLHFSADNALTNPTAQNAFSLQSYIEGYLQNSPELKADKNNLSVAENQYKNAKKEQSLSFFAFFSVENAFYHSFAVRGRIGPGVNMRYRIRIDKIFKRQ